MGHVRINYFLSSSPSVASVHAGSSDSVCMTSNGINCFKIGPIPEYFYSSKFVLCCCRKPYTTLESYTVHIEFSNINESGLTA
jgi:hypothetical protein